MSKNRLFQILYADLALLVLFRLDRAEYERQTLRDSNKIFSELLSHQIPDVTQAVMGTLCIRSDHEAKLLYTLYTTKSQLFAIE